MAAIGQSVPRTEGRAKVTGQARYLDDLRLPGMLHGVTVRSPSPRGIIRDIRYGRGIPWDAITIVTAADIPGANVVALITDDQPYLAAERVNHAEEPVLLLAHADPLLLEEARRSVTIEIDPLPPVFTMDEALSGREIIWGDDNLFKTYLVSRGDVDAAWASADTIVEGEYDTGAQEQLYIEPNGMLAVAHVGGDVDGVTVWGSMQCPYYIHKALAALFDLPSEKIRVVQMETGGGFGGKEEYPSILAGHAALLAWKSERPVKMVYDRAEDMVATTKRHPSRTRHRTGITKDGRLVAMEIDFTIDGGAYCTLTPVVLSRGTIHAPGPYFCPNVRVRARAVATNAPPHGAFRGFGAPQSLFALERHMDRVAAAVGLPPDEFRRRNFIQTGQTSAVGQVMSDPVDMAGLLERALTLSDYHAKRARFESANPGSALKKGIGFAAFMHGAGFTGSGEDHLASIVTVEATVEGRVRVLTASTEIGQGTNTIFSQIAADALGIDVGAIDVVQPDTAVVPNSGPTVASRTCMVVGKLVESAALELRATLERKLGTRHGLRGRVRRLHPAVRGAARLVSVSRRRRRQVGRPALRGGRLRLVRVGRLRRRSDDRHRDLRGAARRLRRAAGSRQGHQPRAGGRTDRGGRRAGDRVDALRAGRLARGPDGQRADDQLHHADVDGPPADPRVLRGSAVRARARRREGHRRAADGRPRAGDRQRRVARGRRQHHQHSHYPREIDGADGGIRCLTRRSPFAAVSTGATRRCTGTR